MTSTQETLSQARQCHEEGRFHAAADLLLKAYRNNVMVVEEVQG